MTVQPILAIPWEPNHWTPDLTRPLRWWEMHHLADGYLHAAIAPDPTSGPIRLETRTANLVDWECRRFMDTNRERIKTAHLRFEYFITKVGGDFWASRNGLPGFAGRGLGELGLAMHQDACRFGPSEFYRGDNGEYYHR
jgi:hypothetical protein